ncbi:glycosyltransferase [Mucilaginibacter pocheonensis]|uniref:Glycosyltransferase involved in cell wall biosynthesis n=1 Tax=Mucilaginibacter pocheonensis TaxID=398050 RepID=A0ABU1TFV5_9SPHI|nr:glycosyltransferase [Mucilaginibacter pocheonensis]MDR6944287.1 glycosyltransferase involved in cell wall biosynthesis [Mucilaginibacter pocheonensis]
MNNKEVSIIIPTYKDWDRLSLCLNSLKEQSYNPELFEIIVVNNYAEDKIPAGYDIPQNCKVITEKTPGSYAARNTGISLSTGSIIGFTDSDCIADKDWITNAVKFLESNDCDRIAGRINLYYHSKKLTEAELYEKIYAFNQDIYVNQDGTGVTGNMFSYRHVFDKVGLFREDLLSGGDYEWSIRARDAGFKIEYVDNAVINHPARHNLSELISKAKRVGGGQAGFGKPEGKNKFKSIINLIYDLRPPVKSIRLIQKKGKDLRLAEKILVFYIRYYLSVITAREKFMVNLGKTAQRN